MTNDVMEMAIEVEDLNMEARELSLGELDNVSAGVIPIIAFVAYNVGLAAGFAFGRWLRSRLN